MTISMYAMAVDSFVPMLESLSKILDKGAAYAADKKLDPSNARLAPDMYTLVQQVQIACDAAKGGVARLMGKEPPRFEDDEKTFGDLKARIAKTIDYVKTADAAAFKDAEERNCAIPLPGDMECAMNGLQFLRGWALPNFYFHVVTAYDILRNNGVAIGKADYLSQVGPFIRPRSK
jgi:uncharacterized protein